VAPLDVDSLEDRPGIAKLLVDSLGFVEDEGRLSRSVDQTSIKGTILSLAKATKQRLLFAHEIQRVSRLVAGVQSEQFQD
jgi:hypothetical protein